MKEFIEGSLGRIFIPNMDWCERSCRHTDYLVSYLEDIYQSNNSQEQFTNRYFVIFVDSEMFDTALEWTLLTQLRHLDLLSTFDLIVDKPLDYCILDDFEKQFLTKHIYALHNRIEKYMDAINEIVNDLVVSKFRDLLLLYVKDEWQVCAQPLEKGNVIINNLHDEKCLWLVDRRTRFLYSMVRHRLKCLKHKIQDTLHNLLIIIANESLISLSRENKRNPKFAI